MIKCIVSDLAIMDKHWSDEFNGADCIIQLSAQIAATSREPFDRNNITATQNIILAMDKHKIKHTNNGEIKLIKESI